jgi:hypothetical protein
MVGQYRTEVEAALKEMDDLDPEVEASEKRYLGW